jgi:hypothetical protein
MIERYKLIDKMIMMIKIDSKFKLFKLNSIEKVLDKYSKYLNIVDEELYLDDWLEFVEKEIKLRKDNAEHRENLALLAEEERYDNLVKTKKNKKDRSISIDSNESFGETTEEEKNERLKWNASLNIITQLDERLKCK